MHTTLTVLAGDRQAIDLRAGDAQWMRLAGGLRLRVGDGSATRRPRAFAARHGLACPCCPSDPTVAVLRQLLRLPVAERTRAWLDAAGRTDLASIIAGILADDVLSAEIHFDGIVAIVGDSHAYATGASTAALDVATAVADRVVRASEDASGAELVGLPLFDPWTGRFRVDEWLPDPALCDVRMPPEAGIHPLSPPWRQATPPAWPQVLAWLEDVGCMLGRDCLRLKAVLDVHGCDAPVALHAIGGTFQPAAVLVGAGLAPQRPRCTIVRRGRQPMSPPSTMRFVAVQ